MRRSLRRLARGCMSAPIIRIPAVTAPGIPILIESQALAVTLRFRSAEEAEAYAADLERTLREFAHLWRRPTRTPPRR